VDGSGYIDYTEFVASAMKKDDLMSGTKLERAFHMFDNDNSGSISLKEIRQVLGLTENA
jgi:calcium-dependent protein kinase